MFSTCPPSVTPQNLFNRTARLPTIEKQIMQYNQKQRRYSITWCFLNMCLLAVTLYDLMHTCRIKLTYIQYFEYTLATIFTINIVYHSIRYLKFNIESEHAKQIALLNKSLQEISSKEEITTPKTLKNIVSISKSPMDTSAVSWLSNASYNDSQHLSMSFQCTPKSSLSPAYRNITTSPIIASNLSNNEVENEGSLHQYLKDYELETTQNVTPQEQSTNLLSFFWNHPSTKMHKDVSPFLRCQYQLSTPTSSSSPKSDEKGSPMNQGGNSLDTWKRLNVNSVALIQWNENLRVWLSKTILDRLLDEFEKINKSLHAQGFADICIGTIGLDRLRKTAQIGPILQSIPNLPTIIPFLEFHPNQEYLVKRIRELSKGGCMSEYKWNGGSSFNGVDWDSSLPTDAAILMHLTACYLDTQLLPQPNQPDIKPFSGYYFIKATDKFTVMENTLAVHEVSVNPPHYRVIVGDETFEMVKGYNNLFHSILLFLYYVNIKEHGLLGRINLGRAGINMLWIIHSN